MSEIGKKIKELYYKHSVEHKWPITNQDSFVAGYSAGVESVKDKAGTMEIFKLPCGCDLYENQVCDFCQQVVMGLRMKIKDKETANAKG